MLLSMIGWYRRWMYSMVCWTVKPIVESDSSDEEEESDVVDDDDDVDDDDEENDDDEDESLLLSSCRRCWVNAIKRTACCRSVAVFQYRFDMVTIDVQFLFVVGC